jgi:hypothetical protein
MADGRLFTDYRPRCDIQLERQAALAGSIEYRQYLISHGQEIVASMRTDAHERAKCGLCKSPYDVGTMLPEADVFRCDKLACQRIRVPGLNDGLGTGRAYGAPPEAQAWQSAVMAQRQRASQAAGAAKNCCACDSQGAYEPVATLVSRQHQDVRWAVPGAGTPLSSSGAAAMGCAVPQPA